MSRGKRTLSVLVVLALCLGMLPGAAWALPDTERWTDDLTEAPEGWVENDDGSVTISTPEALAWLAVCVNGQNGQTQNVFDAKTIYLGADIDLSGKDWIPIGLKGGFRGDFDGQGHTVSNMTIDIAQLEDYFSAYPLYIGFFGSIYQRRDGRYKDVAPGFIRDFHLEDISITGAGRVKCAIGGLAGSYSCQTFYGMKHAEITGCSVSGEISFVADYHSPNIGGMFSSLSGIEGQEEPYTVIVSDCSADVDISGNPIECGGFVAYMQPGSQCSRCSAAGNIDVEAYVSEESGGLSIYAKDAAIGGFVGYIDTAYPATSSLEDCYSTGDVNVRADLMRTHSVGGFAGEVYGYRESCMDGCMASGDVNLTEIDPDAEVEQFVGGFIGAARNSVLEISNSYCFGDVTVSGGDPTTAGGFAGTSNAQMENCYTLSNVTASGDGNDIRAFGFVGNLESSAGLDNCYALGETMESPIYVSSFLTAFDGAGDCYHYGDMELNGINASNPSTTPLDLSEIADGSAFSSLGNAWMEGSGPIPILKNIPRRVQETEKPYYLYKTVTFDSLEGSEVASVTVFYGESIEAPESTLLGYTLNGWYIDENFETEWDFDSDVVTENITLYANWELSQYTVSFESNGGSEVEPQTVSYGGTATKPEDPVRDGYTFLGWYSDETLETEWNFECSIVTENVVLYAKWELAAVHVTSVTLNEETLFLKVSETAQLTATVAPENADDKTVTWTTSDPAVAEVDATGLVTAKSAGGAVITVTTTDGGYEDTCTVTVTAASIPEGPGTPGTPGNPGNPGTPSTPSKPDAETPAPDEATPSPGDDPGTEGPAHNFTDLGGGDAWYQDAVDYVVSNGIMNGYSETTFGPDENLSRAQLAQILYNMEGLPAVTGGSGFADVSPAAWYAAAVAWAAGSNVVTGYGNGLFGPDDDITREQFVMILWRYAGSPAPTGASLGFADADAASEWAVDALRWAVEQGILSGSNGLLAPQELATRAQAAQMLWRFCEVVKQ